MFSSNSLKIFFVFAALFSTACSSCQSKTDANASNTTFVAEELKSDVPFSTREPNEFQTEIVIQTNGGGVEKFFTARSGANRLTVFDYQKVNEVSFLQTERDESFLIYANQKIYAEKHSENTDSKSEPLNDFLTAELLNRKKDAKFESLGAENDLEKYRVNLDDAPNSEIIIFYDGKIGLPIKQEFYTVAGEEKILMMTMELKNFRSQLDAKFFEIPKDFRKVSTKEFYEIARRAK